MIVFTTFVYCYEGFLANHLITKMVKAMSRLVSIIENMSDPVIPWYSFYLV